VKLTRAPKRELLLVSKAVLVPPGLDPASFCFAPLRTAPLHSSWYYSCRRCSAIPEVAVGAAWSFVAPRPIAEERGMERVMQCNM